MGFLTTRSRPKTPAATQPGDDEFRLMVDLMPQLAWMTDKDGSPLWYNQRWYDYTGMTLADIKAKGRTQIIHPEHADRVTTKLKQNFSSGLEWEETFPIKSKDGDYHWFLSRGEPIRDEQGNIVRWFGTHTDITKQLELEHSLREAVGRAEVASNAKSEFLANMSHEIRTPMNVVIGLANILARSNPLSPKQRQFIGTLQSSANALLGLINDLLDFAKIEAQTLEFEKLPFNISALLTEIGEGIGVRAREKNLELRMNIQDENLDVVGDPTRIRQIVTNLAGNAIKFTQSGYVEIALVRKPLPDGRSSEIEIRVSDTGIGIPADKIDNIFQKFTQADTSISRKFGGTGLGLAISRALAQAMGGDIDAASIEGRGSTFALHVCMPHAIKTKAIPDDMRYERGADFARGKRILLVEDHAPNILVARTVIEDFGLECDTALNGREALEKMSTHDYLAIVMDIQMPELDGLETTRRWRKIEQERGVAPTPIIGMTAYARTEDRAKCLEAGMDEYISKPFGINDLRAKLESCVALPQLKAA
ncbi:MAG TPA: ATP-binding protein [Alphaproteobacteria bacterium]